MSELKPCRVDSVSGWCLEHDAKGRLQETLYCDKGPNPYRTPPPSGSVELSLMEYGCVCSAHQDCYRGAIEGCGTCARSELDKNSALVRRLMAGCAKCADTGNPGDTKAVWKRKAMEAEARCAAKDEALREILARTLGASFEMASDISRIAQGGLNGKN